MLFRYAIHAPNDGYEPDLLAELIDDIKAEVVVFHDIFWEYEWDQIIRTFKCITTKLCVESVSSVHDPLKLMRRFDLKRCLDLEHLQMQCAGVFEEEFIPVMHQASHVHMTGYFYGSNLWHTHIHQSPEHNIYLLSSLRKTAYSGFVVSEAKSSLQTFSEIENLYTLAKRWRSI